MEALAIIGVIVFVIGGIGFLIAAFQESILWGIGCILISPISLVFLVLHWRESKNPFFLQVIGIAIVIASSMLQKSYV